MEHRTHSPRRPQLLPTLALAGLLLLPLVAACGGDDQDAGTAAPNGAETTAAADDAATANDVQNYEVRGQITGLPDDADPQANLTIRHEAIDQFVSMNGEVVGMSSMSMPFPVADEVDLGEMEVGDKVRFTLTVDWDGDPAYQVTTMETLPEDTELEYRKARPAGMDNEGMDQEGMEDEGDSSES